MSLSREALGVLELLPLWQLRPEFRPQEPATDQGVLMLAGLAHSEGDRALWASIASVMRSMGFPAAVIEAALILDTPQSDLWTRQLLQTRPSHLLVFGKEMTEAIMACWPPAIASRPDVSCLPSFAEMRATPAAKARAWSALCALRRAGAQ